MSVSITSRYQPLGIIEAPDANGALHATVPIRRAEPRLSGAANYHHRVTGVEDVEYLSWRFLGAGDVWWKIADANPVRFPLDLRAGDALEVPANGDGGRIVSRDRRFT